MHANNKTTAQMLNHPDYNLIIKHQLTVNFVKVSWTLQLLHIVCIYIHRKEYKRSKKIEEKKYKEEPEIDGRKRGTQYRELMKEFNLLHCRFHSSKTVTNNTNTEKDKNKNRKATTIQTKRIFIRQSNPISKHSTASTDTLFHRPLNIMKRLFRLTG